MLFQIQSTTDICFTFQRLCLHWKEDIFLCINFVKFYRGSVVELTSLVLKEFFNSILLKFHDSEICPVNLRKSLDATYSCTNETQYNTINVELLLSRDSFPFKLWLTG